MRRINCMDATMARKKLPPLTTYTAQLIDLATIAGVDLRDAFLRARVPLTTYYRSVTGDRSLSLPVARKVRDAIERLAQ